MKQCSCYVTVSWADCGSTRIDCWDVVKQRLPAAGSFSHNVRQSGQSGRHIGVTIGSLCRFTAVRSLPHRKATFTGSNTCEDTHKCSQTGWVGLFLLPAGMFLEQLTTAGKATRRFCCFSLSHTNTMKPFWYPTKHCCNHFSFLRTSQPVNQIKTLLPAGRWVRQEREIKGLISGRSPPR